MFCNVSISICTPNLEMLPHLKITYEEHLLMDFLMIVIESSSIFNLLLLWHKHVLNSLFETKSKLKMKSILQLRTIFGALIILICLICFDRFKSSRKDNLVQGDYFQGGVTKFEIRKSEHFFTFKCRQCHARLINWVL